MIHNISVNIDEIVDLAPIEEQECLFRRLLYDSMSEKSRVKSIKWLLNDLLECEMEFDKREELIKAYKTVINSIE